MNYAVTLNTPIKFLAFKAIEVIEVRPGFLTEVLLHDQDKGISRWLLAEIPDSIRGFISEKAGE